MRPEELQLDQEVGYVVEFQNGLASYLEITVDEERAMTLAHEREVSN